MKLCEILLSKIIRTDYDSLFGDIIGYDHIKMALSSDSAVHILLLGPPASAKTMFLTSLMHYLNCYFTDGNNSTKDGMIDYLIENMPKYLLMMKLIKWPRRTKVCS